MSVKKVLQVHCSTGATTSPSSLSLGRDQPPATQNWSLKYPDIFLTQLCQLSLSSALLFEKQLHFLQCLGFRFGFSLIQFLDVIANRSFPSQSVNGKKCVPHKGIC